MPADSTKELETSLVNLFKTSRDDPWSLLMIQTLVWCFRRWAIHYLSSDETTTTMREFLWDSHLDLVDQFSPPDLREFALVWLNPDHLGDRSETLANLNAFFLQMVDAFDHALESGDDDEQNALADFLDVDMTRIMDEWLEGREAYRIYPTAEESADTFSTYKIYTIMERILDKFVITAPAVQPVSAEPQAQPVSTESQQQPPQQPTTVAAALQRRRTRKVHRRAQDTRGKTRKIR